VEVFNKDVFLIDLLLLLLEVLISTFFSTCVENGPENPFKPTRTFRFGILLIGSD